MIAQWLQKLDPQSDGAARDWVAIYDECSRILYEEINYRLEGANADRFRRGCQHNHVVLGLLPVQLACLSHCCSNIKVNCNVTTGQTSRPRSGSRCPRSGGTTRPARC